MTTYTLSTAPASFSLTTVSNDEQFVSLTGAYQVQARTGTRWRLSMTWRRGGSAMRTLRGELGQLQNMRQRLYVPMARLGYVRGGSTSTSGVAVHGAHTAGASTLVLRGLTANTSNILLPGDFLQVGAYNSGCQLHQVTTALNSTGSPNTRGTVGIWPPLNRNRGDGDSVYLDTPGGNFIMMSEFGFNAEPMPAASNWYSELSAEFVEDVLA